jgi:hypothetical protein
MDKCRPANLEEHLQRQQRRAMQIQHLAHMAWASESQDDDDLMVVFEVIEEIAQELGNELESLAISKAMLPSAEVQS